MFQSICPIIKWQSKKANIVANALSRSQPREIEDSTVIMAMVIEDQFSTLSGVSMDPDEKVLQKWMKAYQANLSYKTALNQLCQEKQHQEHFLTPKDLMLVMKGINSRSLFLSPCTKKF